MNLHQSKFTAVERAMIANPCSGCMFDSEKVAICKDASVLAISRGFPDCDHVTTEGKRIIYVSTADERQIELLGEEV